MAVFTYIKMLLWEVFHIFFRHYNFPCKLEMIPIGNPDENSPVFVSGNYTLTVHRLRRVLRGQKCWLLVANSRGSNVWCAAGMNEFTEHDVIDAINVARLSDVVKHRRVILPPYGAPGVDVHAVKEATGFRVVWGPTHLRDLPRYIANGYKRTNDMVLVQFGFLDRMEQALSTALAYTFTIGILAIFWPGFIIRLVGLIFLTYIVGFALSEDLLPSERMYRKTAIVAALLVGGLVGVGLYQGWSTQTIVLWGAVEFGVVLFMAMDGCGSSALYKTTIKHWLTHGDYESLFEPIVDPEACTNCMACVIVCPRSVYAGQKGRDTKVVSVAPSACIECQACVKQCADEAIYNRSGLYKGDVKTIPNINHLMTRSWNHIEGELRWIGAKTELKNGLPFVVSQASGAAEAAGVSVPEDLLQQMD
jgi:NAD-dependent dihydropyrimidine dehydrogenase PreA subunit